MNPAQTPLISVIVPTHNRGHLIKRAIESILNQTFQDFEVIVVDDGSTDSTEEVIKKINNNKVVYVKHDSNKGASAARNTGIKNSRGKYIAFLDSDDIWLKDKLEKQLNEFNLSSPDTAVVHCGVQYIDYKTQQPLTQWIIREDVNKNIFNNFGAAPGTPTMLIRKDALLDVGFFDESIPSHEETELSMRLAKKYKFALVDEFLVLALKNHSQITANPDLFIRGKEIIYEKHKDYLTKYLAYNLCNIIAGDSIIKENYQKARKYLFEALKHKPFKIKTVFSLALSLVAPQLNRKLYKMKYGIK
mgnify:CR=1 FL=1